MKEFNDNFESAILNKGSAHCYLKNIQSLRFNDEDVVVYTKTRMVGVTEEGTYAAKYITIDDEKGEVTEDITAVQNLEKPYHFHNCNLTGYRCSEMTALAIVMLYGTPKRVGFIGTGKTNLLNCIAIRNYFGTDDIVIRGSRRNLAKNAGDFMTVCTKVAVDTSDDMRLLNECDVVIECCSNCNRDELITDSMLYGPTLIVALDSGYLLDESFRDHRMSFADWPHQLEKHYEYEFIFDKHRHGFKQLRHDHEPYEKAVVYLYGIGIADAVAAERMIDIVEGNGMERPFLVRGEA